MSNMSYCRYSNTAIDFENCLEALQDNGLSDLGETERMYAHKLYEAAMKYIVEYESQSDIIARWVETPNGGKVLTTYRKEDKQ